MRVAVSGAHHTGKTTLIEALIGSLPTFSMVDEPYYLLEEEGYVFSEMPGIEDFELQLERSISAITESAGDCLFDRCPFDFIAYLTTHDESERFIIDDWIPRMRRAMQLLDLVIFIPVEEPDRISLSPSADRSLRQRVDEMLQEIVLEDPWGVGVPAITAAGSVEARANLVLRHLDGGTESYIRAIRR